MATTAHRPAQPMTERIVSVPSVERVARMLHGDALRVVRSLVGRDYELGAEDIWDIAWTVALWVSVDVTETGAPLVPEVTALHRQALRLRARIELRDFRAFRVPRVRVASGAGSTRVRVAVVECDVDSLADARVQTPPPLSPILERLEMGLSAYDKSVLPHHRPSETALTPAERKRIQRVKQRLRDHVQRCPGLASEVADYFESI